ncbi:DUF305 domain-containing protein [Microbacterium sp. cx-59]|uniref:DUF305 domain-containing protein n=1 Tax=Microbacterium sp. cx-59 TaxID=2891207 RepID=UPI001E3FDE51|nr:DUF305 domain-containing protein [Microbacterium sp. cx-59]MCC4909019.1 DUF305 domain-containing protein [Microbacterium sp. cx-59]
MTTDAARPRRWPIIVLAVVGVAALAFAIGRFSLFSNGPAVPNAADIGFARDMQVHHDQAVQMAMSIYRVTADDDIRALSYDIATGQAAQRGEMFDWLVQWNVPQSGDLMSWMADSDEHAHSAGSAATEDELRAQMGMATDAELAALDSATGTPADCMFLGLMIRHHQGALEMTDAVADLGSIPRVLQVAETMATNQGAEIGAMQSIQNRLGCAG